MKIHLYCQWCTSYWCDIQWKQFLHPKGAVLWKSPFLPGTSSINVYVFRQSHILTCLPTSLAGQGIVDKWDLPHMCIACPRWNPMSFGRTSACCFSAFYMICVFTQICFLWVVCVLVCSLYQFIPRCSSFAVQMYADLQGLLSQDLSQTWWGVRSLQQPVCMGTWPSTDDCRALYQHVQGSHKDDSLAHPSWWVGFCHLDSKVSHHFFGGQNWWSSKRENSLSKWNW